MKKFILIAIIFSAWSVSAQQSFKVRMADRSMKSLHYYDAAKYLEEQLAQTPNDTKVAEKLAECYRKMNDPVNAAKYYAIAVNGSPSDESLLYYAQALAQTGDYSASSTWYQNYANKKSGDARGRAFANAYNDMSAFYRDSSLYKVKTVDFNSEYSDFSPRYYKDSTMVFCSARKRQYIIKNTFAWDNSSYLEIYKVKKDSVSLLHKEINTPYHEGTCAFSRNFDTIFFTRNNYMNIRPKKGDDGVIKLKIYTSHDVEGDWKDVQSFKYNSNDYSMGHPCFSADYNTLFFVSDMPGGYGGTDIYFSKREVGGHWSKPENMGPRINTLGNEMFPYMDADTNFYFSSDGHPGLGGLDIFEAQFEKGYINNPKNMGYPINSNRDDFGLIFKAEDLDGYFSSNREGGKGSDDIYYFTKNYQRTHVYVYDSRTKEVLTQTDLVVNMGQDMVKSIKTAVDKSDKIVIMPGMSYSFAASREDYYSNTIKLSPDQLFGLDTVKIPLERVVFALKGRTYKEMNGKALGDAKVTVKNKKTGELLTEIITPGSGMYFFDLQKNTEYEISASHPTLDCNEITEVRTTEGLRESDTLEANFPFLCVGDVIKLDNIYYDLGKSDIRADAAIELDKMVAIMKRYPGMIIELGSHTDSRGNDFYNMSLSDARAKSAANYVISKGINSKRVTGKGYGETMIINRCTNGVNCSEDEHTVNRRSEFKVISMRFKQ